MQILIRYNHSAENYNQKWRLIIDGTEHLVSQVTFECDTKTSCDEIEIDGRVEVKWHITAISPQKVIWEYGGFDYIHVVVQ